MIMRLVHRSTVLAISLLAALSAATAVADHAVADVAGGRCMSLSRPTPLPLPTGADQGEIDGGMGTDALYGSVTPSGGSVHLPAAWYRRPETGTWSVRDLSRGGTITGFATGQDARGDVLISSGVVLTRRGDVITLPTFTGPHTSVYARRINARGQIAGGVAGPDPDDIFTGAVWDSPTTPPRALDPLPVSGAVDSLALGINERGDTVGNSDVGTNDYAGGYWPARSAAGVPLPGLTASHSFPFQINNSGLIAGFAGNDDFSLVVAALWDRDGSLIDLGTARPGDAFAALLGLSDNGRATGTSSDDTSSRVIYWRGGVLRSLLPLSGTWTSGRAGAHYVTNNGFIGGDSVDARGNDQPVVWPCADLQSFPVSAAHLSRSPATNKSVHLAVPARAARWLTRSAS